MRRALLGAGVLVFALLGAPGVAAQAALPDGRSYELVSPPEKHGAYIEGIGVGGGSVQAAQDGSAFAYVVQGAINESVEGNRSPEAQQVLATRDPSVWTSQELVPPNEHAFGVHGNVAQQYEAFSSDLSLSLLHPAPFGLTPLAEPPLAPPQSEAERGHQEKTIYIRNDAPIKPEAFEEALYGEAVQNGEKIAAEHGEAAKPGYVALVNAANVAEGVKFGGEPLAPNKVQPQLGFLDATPDLSHVIIASNTALLAGSSPSGGLYEWSGGKLNYVSILPAEGKEPERPDTETEPRFGYAIGVELLHNGGTNYRHAISSDGSRVIWGAFGPGSEGFGPVASLYMREVTRGKSLRLDIPEPALKETQPEIYKQDLKEPGKARFQIASSDGSKVFFTSTRRLTVNSTATFEQGSGTFSRPDLYECEIKEIPVKKVPTPSCTHEQEGKPVLGPRDLTPDTNEGESAAVQGLVAGASEDGSYVYLVADGVLGSTAAEGAKPGACNSFTSHNPPPSPVTCNLYVLHDESGHGDWTTKLVGRLSSEDAPDWFNPQLNGKMLITQPTRVSPNGRFLAFMSNQRLTGYDNTDINETGGAHADEEVFLYDAQAPSAQALTCPSCNPSGERPRGVFDQSLAGVGKGLVVDRPETWAFKAGEGGADINAGVDHWLAGSLPGWTTLSISNGIYQSRYLSDSGRLFFNGADAIVPEAQGTRPEKISSEEPTAEAQVGVERVYQYEPGGVGGCTETAGCLSLISAGNATTESAFQDASASGNDVFFLTQVPLLPQDQDAELDIYDARTCTSESPCQPVPPPPAQPCNDIASCHGGVFGVPSFQQPPSSSLSGSGNLTPGPTPKAETLPTKTSKPPSRAHKLAVALRACRRAPHHTAAQRRRRHRCEVRARHRYGAKKASRKGSR